MPENGARFYSVDDNVSLGTTKSGDMIEGLMQLVMKRVTKSHRQRFLSMEIPYLN